MIKRIQREMSANPLGDQEDSTIRLCFTEHCLPLPQSLTLTTQEIGSLLSLAVYTGRPRWTKVRGP